MIRLCLTFWERIWETKKFFSCALCRYTLTSPLIKPFSKPNKHLAQSTMRSMKSYIKKIIIKGFNAWWTQIAKAYDKGSTHACLTGPAPWLCSYVSGTAGAASQMRFVLWKRRVYPFAPGNGSQSHLPLLLLHSWLMILSAWFMTHPGRLEFPFQPPPFPHNLRSHGHTPLEILENY